MPAGKAGPAVPEFHCLHCGQVWDSVESQAEIMRALPRSRFRGPGGKQVILSRREAVRLEDLERELRSLGLVEPRHIFHDEFGDGLHFGVQCRDKSDPIAHELFSGKEGTQLSPHLSPSGLGRGARVKGLSGASLDAGEPLGLQGGPSTLCKKPGA